MGRCRHCGMPIEYRFIDGRCTPLHTQGGCSASVSVHRDTGRFASTDSCCSPANCPTCGSKVFFVRHNGGSVYLDPPLGYPWPRHGCFPPKVAKIAADKSDVRQSDWPTTEAFNSLGVNQAFVLGVVTLIEISPDRKRSILSMAVGESDELVLLVRGAAKFLVGKLVALAPTQSLISSIDDPGMPFKVETALAIPSALSSHESALLKQPGNQPPSLVTDVDGFLRTENLAPSVIQILRGQRRRGPKARWNIHKILPVIDSLEGRDREEIVHVAAMLIMEHCARCGDCTRAIELAKKLNVSDRGLLSRWFRRYSPILLDLERKDRKAFVGRAADGTRPPFRLQEALANPYFGSKSSRQTNHNNSPPKP